MLGIHELKWLHIARVTVELTSPLTIGSGDEGSLEDSPVVRDASGLPMIPATSLIGVLRSLWTAQRGEDEAGALFGYQRGDKGQRSYISSSSGVLHDSTDRPAAPLIVAAEGGLDPLLGTAMTSLVVRDHVRLNSSGVVDGRGKFDRTAVHAGHRFTFELSLRGKDLASHEEFNLLLALLHAPETRLGAKTGSGAGAFRVVRCLVGRFDLSDSKDFNRYLAHPVDLRRPAPALQSFTPPPYTPRGAVAALSVALRPISNWLQGGGELERHSDKDGKGPKIVPYQEPKVVWAQEGGKLKGRLERAASEQSDYLLTGSSLRGALRHRAAFHMRRLIGAWASPSYMSAQRGAEGQAGGDIDPLDPATLRGMHILFGEINDSRSKEGRGWRGCLQTCDMRVPAESVKEVTYDHLSIDRFSGAPLSGHLFSDVALAPAESLRMSLTLSLKAPRALRDEEQAALKVACYALHLALRDLTEGRLQLGAGAGRGYGYFERAEAARPSWRGDGELHAHLNGAPPRPDDLAAARALNSHQLIAGA